MAGIRRQRIEGARLLARRSATRLETELKPPSVGRPPSKQLTALALWRDGGLRPCARFLCSFVSETRARASVSAWKAVDT